MAIAEGTTNAPQDNGGRYMMAVYDGSVLWLPRTAAGIASGRALAVTPFGATGTTALFPNAAALADGASLPTTTQIGAVIQGYDGSNLRFAKMLAANADMAAADKIVEVAAEQYVYDTAAGGPNRVYSPASISAANTGQRSLTALPILGNGTNFDPQLNNTQATIFAGAARTAAAQSATLTNHNARGALFHLRVTAKAAATTLNIQLYPISLIANTLICAVAQTGNITVAAGTDYYFLVYPGVLQADITTNNFAKSLALSRQYVAYVLPSDANSVTYSLDVNYIL